MTNEVPYPLNDKLWLPKIANIGFRHIFTNIYRIIAPAKIEVYKDSLHQLETLTKDNYAVLVLGLHYSRAEGFDFITRPAEVFNYVYGLPVVMPVAFHQYADDKTKTLAKLLHQFNKTNLRDYFDNKMKGFLQVLTRLNGVTPAAVVNSDTVEKGLNKVPGTNIALDLGYGFPEYVRLMTQLIERQGVSGIAEQAGRRKSLEIEQAKQRTLETLLYAIAREKIKEQRRIQPDSPRLPIEEMIRQFKIAIILMPIRPMYKADYDKLYDSYGFFKKKHIQIGPVFTIDELYQVRDETNKLLKSRFEHAKKWFDEYSQTHREAFDPTADMKKTITLDEVVLTILSFGSDPEYNKISREEGWAQAVVEAIDIIEAVREVIQTNTDSLKS